MFGHFSQTLSGTDHMHMHFMLNTFFLNQSKLFAKPLCYHAVTLLVKIIANFHTYQSQMHHQAVSSFNLTCKLKWFELTAF